MIDFAMLKQAIHRFLLDKDPTGFVLKLSHPTHTSDPNLVGIGDGVYKSAEWSLTRQKGHSVFGADGTEYDTDHKYFRHMMRESGKVRAALDLADKFDFGHYKFVLDVGAGEVIMGAIIKSRFESIRYCASDYDPFVIRKVSGLSILSGIETKVLDASKLGPQDLAGGIDLVVSWGLEYALDDDALLRLLSTCAAAKVDYLMCTHSVTSLAKFIIYRTRRKSLDAQVSRREVRMHGWMRSIALLKEIGRKAGYQTRYIGNSNHAVNYRFLLFQPS